MQRHPFTLDQLVRSSEGSARIRRIVHLTEYEAVLVKPVLADGEVPFGHEVRVETLRPVRTA